MAPIDTTTGYEPRPRTGPRVLLRMLREVMAEETQPQVRLDRLVKTIANNLVAEVCSIYVRRADDMLELFATEGLNASAVHSTRLAMTEGLVGLVARQSKPLRIRDAPSHEAFLYLPEIGEDPYHAFLGVPVVRSGQVIGVLVIQNRALRDFSNDEVDVAQTVATILAEIIASGALLEQADADDVAALLHKPEFALGAPIVPGVVQGTVYRLEPAILNHPTFAKNVAKEQTRLLDGLADLRKSIDNIIAADSDMSGASKEVLEVFRLFAYDKGWAQKLDEKVLSGLSAESAVEQVQEENHKKMRRIADPYLRERFHDLEDLSRRLLRTLSGEGPEPKEIPEGAVLLTETLGPVEILDLNTERLSGLVVSEAAGVSHAAVVARSLRLPMVSGVPEIVDKALHGDTIAFNGATGEVHLRPTDATIRAYKNKAELAQETLARYSALKDAPAQTFDGIAIDLQMNAGLPIDMAHLDETGAKSIGLFRTELQFLLGQSLPSASEQEDFYRQILDAAGDRPVLFRTADIGSDKRAAYMDGPREVNPAMGWRGLRVSLDRTGLMRTQIRALLRAARARPLKIMLPLVTTTEEFITAKAIINKEIIRHKKHTGSLPPSIEIGAMVEIPSLAWDVRRLAREADFLSIGGNDLAQFFFAADRDSAEVSTRYDALAPSFLSFLRHTVNEAAAGGVPIGYCGEQAGDPLMALALLGIGVERLSVSAGAIGPVKAMIRSVDLAVLRRKMIQLLAEGSPTIRAALQVYCQEHSIELP